MNDKNYNKSDRESGTGETKINRSNQTKNNNRDNISKTNKKKPSKALKVIKMIFFVNFKIISYLINIILTILLIGIITGGIVAGTFAFYIMNDIDPYVEDLVTMSSGAALTTFIYYYDYEDRFNKTLPKGNADEDPNWIKMDELHGSQNRTWVTFDEIPKNLVNAFIALEDKRFWTHNGVDWYRTASAARDFLLPQEGGRIYGGSTITQQLIKLLTEEDAQTIQRKLQEIRRAMYLESRTSKEDIMETYLNIVPLSNGCSGVQSAANTLFNKDVSELNLIECAAIAAIVQSPAKMNPLRPPEPGETHNRNKARRDEGLKNMLEQNLITREEFDSAYDKELVINQPEKAYIETVKSYYVDQIIEDVIKGLMEKYPTYTREMASRKIFSGGLQIYSCMDKYIQDVMEHVYQSEERDQYFPKQAETAIKYQSSMVVLDPYSGDLLGIVGGRGDKVPRGWNRASMTTRQAGSAIKPISVYAPALDSGIIDWGTPMDDSAPMILNRKPWPTNLPNVFEGNITLSRAVAVSKNTTAVRVLMELSPDYSFRFMYEQLEMRSLVEKKVMPDGKIKTDIDIAPLALGGLTDGLSVYELTAAYTMLANNGIYSKPRSYTKVLDQNGDVLLDNMPMKRIVIEPETAWIMTKLLKGVVETGTAKGLPMASKIEVAGKTGTTNEDYDRWFIGYTPYYLCGCWFGYDQNKFLGVGVGTENPPLRLFQYVMDEIHKPIYDNPKTFPELPTITQARYCRQSGMAPGPACEWTDVGYYAKGATPSEMCDLCKPIEEETTEGTTAEPETTTAAEEKTEPIIETTAAEETIQAAIEETTPEITVGPEELPYETDNMGDGPTEEPTIGQEAQQPEDMN